VACEPQLTPGYDSEMYAMNKFITVERLVIPSEICNTTEGLFTNHGVSNDLAPCRNVPDITKHSSSLPCSHEPDTLKIVLLLFEKL